MVHGKQRVRKKGGASPFFAQILICFMLSWLFLLGGTLVITLHFSLSTFQEQVENRLASTATSLADSAMVRQAFQEGQCSKELTGYLDDLVARTADLDVVTIADLNSIRLYHVVHERIGQEFVGGDQARALLGESYFSDAVGTLGLQHRFLTPVRDQHSAVIGFVVTSTTMGSLQVLRSEIISAYGKIIVILVLAALLLSGGLSLLLRRILLGFSPEGLANTYLTQNEVFNNLDEGVISTDGQGRIQLMNQSAEKILGQQARLLEGTALDALLQAEGGASLLQCRGENIRTSRPNILTNCIPLEKEGLRTGTTLILKDKSEAIRQAEQLSGSRHIISALRANSHEFMNKLQVISGLLQMGKAGDALDYIGNISAVHAKAIGPIMQRIHNPAVAALLLGKLDNTRELDIHLTLLSNSDLPEHSQYLSTSDLVAVVGNLLENAIEAINAQVTENSRSIDLQITEDARGLVLIVSDTGIGILPWQLNHIYESSFSTKAAEGRGIGMSLIHDIVEHRGGSIEVDSEPGAGTTFTLIFSKKRKGQ